jgi:8-oxo-dGTP pyrophosphatase MutT (NUDIX family)
MTGMTLDDVHHALTLPRPGRDAQSKLSPRPRPGDIFPLPPEASVKDAGVLILLFPRAATAPGKKHSAKSEKAQHEGLDFFLTRRSETVETHKGQISLPGGMREPGEKLWETALRESAEELQIDTSGVMVFHKPLSQLYIPVSGFLVTPYVGYAAERPEFVAAASEVVEVIEAPLEILVDEKYHREEEWNIRGGKATVPFYQLHHYKIWGATAMILSEFGEMLRHSCNI